MRTEQQLRDAFTSLADTAPAAEDVLPRLQFQRPVPVSVPVVSRRWRIVLAAAVGLILIAVGAIALPYLRPRPLPEPAGGRVVGNWVMVSRLEPPAGWTLAFRQVFRGFETTTLMDPTGKGRCVVEADKRGVTPQTPPTGTTQRATVQGHGAFFTANPGKPAAVYWRYSADAWASVACGLGPKRDGSAVSPAAVRRQVLALAGNVTFGDYPLFLPIRLRQLPVGYAVQSASQSMSDAEHWQVTLTSAHEFGSKPTIDIDSSRAGGDIPRANTRVGNYPASFFTIGFNTPAGLPHTSIRPVSYTNLCIPTAPVGICLSASNTATDDPASRRDLFQTVATNITYAASASDTTTWFDANVALPS